MLTYLEDPGIGLFGGFRISWIANWDPGIISIDVKDRRIVHFGHIRAWKTKYFWLRFRNSSSGVSHDWHFNTQKEDASITSISKNKVIQLEWTKNIWSIYNMLCYEYVDLFSAQLQW